MLAPHMLTNHESLSILVVSVEYGGYKNLVKWATKPASNIEKSTIFCVLADFFLKRKYNPTVDPALIISQKKYQKLNIWIFINKIFLL